MDVKSHIAIAGTMHNLSAPPLDISLRQYAGVENNPSAWRSTNGTSWRDKGAWGFNGTLIDEMYLHQTSRCIGQNWYLWGFSSLLLLTFSVYTFLFGVSLILLQTDVYWNSRTARESYSHSIYQDILFLADELRAMMGHDIGSQSVTALEKTIRNCEGGLTLEVNTLPPTRWQDWNFFRAQQREPTPDSGLEAAEQRLMQNP